MSVTRVTMTALRQHLGDLVNRAAYGREQIILMSRGEPRAAIISIADLERLRQYDAPLKPGDSEQALASVAAVRERIRAWQEENGIQAGDVVADLEKLRGDRHAQLSHLR